MKQTILFATAFLLSCNFIVAQTKAGKADTTKHATFYTCSMHPEIKQFKAGKCPKCGMDLELTTKEQMKIAESRNYSCPVHLEVASHDPGKCPKCGKKLDLSLKEQMKVEAAKIYTCPMHPDVALDKEGKCPKCGKDLIEKKHEH